jgi:N-acetylneuraminic acid mutarotase
MKNKLTNQSGFFCSRILFALPICAAACSIVAGTLLAFLLPGTPANGSQRTLTFAERVAYQRAIEEVYWRHRIWPKERPDPKPSLDAVMSQAQLEMKVQDYLRESQALEDYWQQSITPDELQAEMDRMAQHTKQPEVLRELFEALRNDAFVIAECLARPLLAERSLAYSGSEQVKQTSATHDQLVAATGNYSLPTISDSAGCTDDSWEATTTSDAPDSREWHTAVWTGSEMIVWGGYDGSYLNTGGSYKPSSDSWTATSLSNAPAGRHSHTAVWTGSEMIVWGGVDCCSGFLNTGGRYNPVTDTWTATSTTNAPTGRIDHTVVWTGSEMIVWGGTTDGLNTGGRYNPSTDTWTATSTTGAPTYRQWHTAVWTGTEMIIWGGIGGPWLNTGGKYNPGTDSWTATSTANAPAPRDLHTAVWTGTEMIVWGGFFYDGNNHYFNTGGRYNPSTNVWTPTSVTNAPEPRFFHTAVWTGSEMVAWGGSDGTNNLNTGGRYDPSTDSWRATSTTNAPDARGSNTTVWTGTQMIIWGGYYPIYFNTGGRYCAGTPSPTPTCTPGGVVMLQGSITSDDPTHNSVNGAASSCAVSPPCPGELLGAYHYDAYQLTNSSGNPVCITVTLSDATCIYSEVYLGSVDPNNSCTNYLADSTGADSYSVTVPGNATIWVVVEEFNEGQGCANYTVTVSGLAGCASPTPTPTPTAAATATATATATPTPTSTPRATPTPRVNPTPRLRPSPPPRP